MRKIRKIHNKIYPVKKENEKNILSRSIFIFSLIAIFLFLLIMERFYTIQITMITGKNEKNLKIYTNKYKKYYFEYEKLTSHIRLETFGKETLNMIYPNGEQYANAELLSK